jgi:hypothetical protein
MAVTATPIFPQTISSKVAQFLNADGTAIKSIRTAGTNGERIDGIWLTNTDTNAYTV